MLIVYRRRRAGEVKDFVYFNVERKRHIMTHKFEACVIVQMVDIAFATCE